MKQIAIFCCLIILGQAPIQGQIDSILLKTDTYKGLNFRSIGPAKMAGRIADIGIHPDDDNIWYVAVGSGGLWKTKNAGTTWTPIFDHQSVYSIGCVTIDQSNPNHIWVGTGENVGGRHVGFGDGIYLSQDAGSTWNNMGLKKSEHISKIIIHPSNSNTVYVAAQGPLWSPGGERGFYKSIDGGKTWKNTLQPDQWTGVTDIAIDPRNPERIYAATWSRHRTIATYMGGGPGTGLYKSEDGGNSWQKLTNGLPNSNMGKIGLAISPHNPDILYAAIELDRRTGGVYKSTDRGLSWKKQSDAVSGATGPHYYQELYACPHHFDRLYLIDVRMQISDDGGKTFKRMKEEFKHSDNHAIAFRSDDPDYLLVGTDGGLYESFDLAENWRFFDNMPITQFYKIAVDDAEPFYNVYGGTQDNSTQGGPSRTDNVQGIQNSDWKIVLNWDGHQPATEPGNPNIMYGQRQEGTLSRIDLSTGEVIDIQPQSDAGESYERFNWDAPILVSPHDPARIFFASQRLWVSDNRGDSWKALSEDLTKNQNRIELPIMGRKQSFDNAWDLTAMSNYNTITSIAQSPMDADLIYIGTDDGLLQITEDYGNTWQKLDLSRIRNVPSTCYVNDIKADLFDPNTVYISLDNHKKGDFKPYLIKSTDRGKTWNSIASNLSEGNLVWRLVQDHVDQNLLFIGTEKGLYFSFNGGIHWVQLKSGLPTISVRDLTIHRRENDLIIGTFGRSIYILDDITPLRNLRSSAEKMMANLSPVKDTWLYIPRSDLGFEAGKGDQGSEHYLAENPPFGATMTVFVPEIPKTITKSRKKAEKKMKNKNIDFPGWQVLEDELEEAKPGLVVEITDNASNVVRRIHGPVKKGFQRINWDLRYPAPNALKLIPDPPALFPEPIIGVMVPSGSYQATAYLMKGDSIQQLGDPQSFQVKQLYDGAIQNNNPVKYREFSQSYNESVKQVSHLNIQFTRQVSRMSRIKKALERSRLKVGEIDRSIEIVEKKMYKLGNLIFGLDAKNGMGEKNDPTLGSRLFAVNRGISNSLYGPTNTHLKMLEIIYQELQVYQVKMEEITSQLSEIEKQIEENGGPLLETDGR